MAVTVCHSLTIGHEVHGDVTGNTAQSPAPEARHGVSLFIYCILMYSSLLTMQENVKSMLIDT